MEEDDKEVADEKDTIQLAGVGVASYSLTPSHFPFSLS